MADVVAPPQFSVEDLKKAKDIYTLIRIGLGEDVKPLDSLKFADLLASGERIEQAKGTIQSDTAKRDAYLKTFADRVVNKGGVKDFTPAKANELLQNFDPAATILSSGQVANFTPSAAEQQKAQAQEKLEKAYIQFVTIRTGLGMPDKETYTKADVTQTAQKLAEAKKDTKLMTVLVDNALKDMAPPYNNREFIEGAVRSADALFRFIQANLPEAVGPATPPRTAQKQQAQALIEIMALGMALSGKAAGKPPTPEEAKTIVAQSAKGVNTATLLTNFKAAVTQLETAPGTPPALIQNLKALATTEGMTKLIANAPTNLALVAPPAAPSVPRQPPAAAPAPAAPTPPAAGKTADEIRKPHMDNAKTILASLGFDVSTREKFDKSATDLKDLIAVVSQTGVKPGVCKPEDCDALLKGLGDYLKGPQYAILQALRKGEVHPDLEKKIRAEHSAIGLGIFKSRLNARGTEGEKLEYALTSMAETAEKKGKPEEAAAVNKIKEINPDLMKKLPLLLDTLSSQGPALLNNLKVVYSPDAALVAPGVSIAPPQPVSAPVPAPAVPAGVQGQPKPSTTAAPLPPVDAPAGEAVDAIIAVNAILKEKIMPSISKFTGVFGKLGLTNNILPEITDAELSGNKFGPNSQKMTAILIMGLKEMAGVQPPDATYGANTGSTLLKAILTGADPKLDMVRQQFEISGKMTAEQFAIAMETDPLEAPTAADPKKPTKAERDALKEYNEAMRLRAEAKKAKDLFDQLDILAKHHLLLEGKDAQNLTKGNMMLDAASALLDKWPGLKKMIVGFLRDTQIGQMIGGLMGFMGMDVERLWKKPAELRTPDQRVQDSIEIVGKTFKSEFDAAQTKLGASAAFPAVMAETKKNIMENMNGVVANIAIKTIFDGADQEMIKKTMQAALAAAEKTGNFADAQKAFTATLQAAGEQWKKDKKIDFTTLAQHAQGIADRAPALQADAQARGFIPPTSPATPGAAFVNPAPMPPAGGATAKPVAPAGTIGAKPLPKEEPLPKGAIRFEADNRIVTVVPKTESTATGVFKDQLPVRASNGRMKDIADVIYNNFEKFGLTGIKQEDLRRGGSVPDAATHALTLALTELSVRGQVRIDPSKDANPKLTQMTINAFAIAQMQHAGVSEAEITKAKTAVDSMAVDHQSFVKGQKLSKAQREGGGPSVLAQTFAGYQYTVKIEAKPAPVVAPPAAAAPAPAVSTEDPDKIKVPSEYDSIFALFKARKLDPNCVPLVFWARTDEKGKIITREDDQKAGRKGPYEDETGFGYKPFVGYIDRNGGNTFSVVPMDAAGEDYVRTRKLPDHIADKILENYTFKITQNGQTVEVGHNRPPLTAEQRPLAIAAIKEYIDCQLGLQGLAPAFNNTASAPAAAPPAAAPAPVPAAAPPAAAPAPVPAAAMPYQQTRAAQQQQGQGDGRVTVRTNTVQQGACMRTFGVASGLLWIASAFNPDKMPQRCLQTVQQNTFDIGAGGPAVNIDARYSNNTFNISGQPQQGQRPQ